jgi:hypothetical protein
VCSSDLTCWGLRRKEISNVNRRGIIVEEGIRWEVLG